MRLFLFLSTRKNVFFVKKNMIKKSWKTDDTFIGKSSSRYSQRKINRRHVLFRKIGASFNSVETTICTCRGDIRFFNDVSGLVAAYTVHTSTGSGGVDV